MNKWSRSGQNDPEEFKDFLSYNNGTLYAVSKRALIIFVCSGLGTSKLHQVLVDSATKEILEGGYEEGIAKNDEDEDDRRRERKRRKRSSAVEEEVDDLSKNVKEMSSFVKEFMQGGAYKTSETTGAKRCAAAQEEESLFKRVKDTFVELQCPQQNSTSVPKIIEYAQLRHEEAMQAYEELRKNNAASGGQRIR